MLLVAKEKQVDSAASPLLEQNETSLAPSFLFKNKHYLLGKKIRHNQMAVGHGA